MTRFSGFIVGHRAFGTILGTFVGFHTKGVHALILPSTLSTIQDQTPAASSIKSFMGISAWISAFHLGDKLKLVIPRQKHSEFSARSWPCQAAVKKCAGDLSMRHHDETLGIHMDTSLQTKPGESERINPR